MTEEQYKQAETFWERQDTSAEKLDRDSIYRWIDKFLSSHNVLALAVGSDHFIRCTPLEYSWRNGALYIFTEGGLKFKALRENNHVAAAVFENETSFGKLKSLQVEGDVYMIEPFSSEYKEMVAYRQIPLPLLQGLTEPMWLIKIVPTEITCLNSDFAKDGYSSRQIWDA